MQSSDFDVNKEGNSAACIFSVETLVRSVVEAWRKGANVVHAEKVFTMALGCGSPGWKVPGSERFS
jgi:hypothetical protein